MFRTLPLSLLIGIPIVTLSYLVVNLSFFATLSYEQILQSDAVALVRSHGPFPWKPLISTYVSIDTDLTP